MAQVVIEAIDRKFTPRVAELLERGVLLQWDPNVCAFLAFLQFHLLCVMCLVYFQ